MAVPPRDNNRSPRPASGLTSSPSPCRPRPLRLTRCCLTTSSASATAAWWSAATTRRPPCEATEILRPRPLIPRPSLFIHTGHRPGPSRGDVCVYTARPRREAVRRPRPPRESPVYTCERLLARDITHTGHCALSAVCARLQDDESAQMEAGAQGVWTASRLDAARGTRRPPPPPPQLSTARCPCAPAPAAPPPPAPSSPAPRH